MKQACRFVQFMFMLIKGTVQFVQELDVLKIEDKLKIEDDPKNEDTLKNEDYHKNEDNQKMKMTSKNKDILKWCLCDTM